MFRAFCLIFVFSFLFAERAVGATAFNVNEGVVSVVKNRQEQREAFKQVVVKMTGTPDSLNASGVKRAIRNAREYILSFEYFVDDEQQRYRAVFDKQKLELLLRSEALPIWGARRPDGIFWLANRQESNIQVVSESSNIDLTKVVSEYAQARGVQILLPLMDLDDSMTVTPTDIWGRFMPLIETASERYLTDYVIAARLVEVEALRESQTRIRQANEAIVLDDAYQPATVASAYDSASLTLERALYEARLQSQLRVNEKTSDTFDINQQALLELPENQKYALEWSISGNDIALTGRFFAQDEETLLTQLIDVYSNSLGEKYAIVPSNEMALQPLMTVANVNNLLDISTLTRYLSDLTVVQSASLVSLQGNVATFSVSLIGTLGDLNNTLTFDDRLLTVDVETDYQSDTLQLHYFWKG